MIKILRCGLFAVLFALLLAGRPCTSFASEEETEKMTEEEPAESPETSEPQVSQIKVPQKGTPGWYQQSGYKFYYDKNGKLVKGWMKISTNWYYFAENDQEEAPAGSMATGLTTIRGSRFFFKTSNGKMVTGWNRKTNGKYRYFEEVGAVGVLGRLCTGKKTIGANTYILNSNGIARTGWITYKGAKYYGQTEDAAGVYGSLYKNGWKKIGDYYYSFTAAGKLKTNRWIGDKYYVDGEGKRLTSCVTPDGWVVDEKGKRVGPATGWVKIGEVSYYYKDGSKQTGWITIDGRKYYLGTDGAAQSGLVELDGKQYYLTDGAVKTGWALISGKKYYFDEEGVMAKNTSIGKIKIDENGVADVKASVLIIAGHGQGDPGATSEMGGVQYMEYNYTREFASLIYDKLKTKCKKTAVVMYDQSYDCYQVNAGKKPGPSPDFPFYDYVLEIHFDAAARDFSGDGVYKGVSILVSASKKDYSLDAAIVSAVVATGFKQYGAGVIARSDLLNMNLCQKLGVSYGLLESAFIDDKDDMTFYNGNKNKMANAVASVIANYFE